MASTGTESGALNEKALDGNPEKRTSRSMKSRQSINGDDTVDTREGKIINSSGHPDQLHRQYGLLSICGLALTVDNAWVAVGTSLAISIYNGGAPGVIWELWIASFYYAFINASIAEVG
jgi:choline transport protein